jgi:hypothetical protein
MGHSEIATTMRYVDVNADDKREAIAAVSDACAREGSWREPRCDT